jgi:hypothetical protein
MFCTSGSNYRECGLFLCRVVYFWSASSLAWMSKTQAIYGLCLGLMDVRLHSLPLCVFRVLTCYSWIWTCLWCLSYNVSYDNDCFLFLPVLIKSQSIRSLWATRPFSKLGHDDTCTSHLWQHHKPFLWANIRLPFGTATGWSLRM